MEQKILLEKNTAAKIEPRKKISLKKTCWADSIKYNAFVLCGHSRLSTLAAHPIKQSLQLF